jgi:hypothetical protein
LLFLLDVYSSNNLSDKLNTNNEAHTSNHSLIYLTWTGESETEFTPSDLDSVQELYIQQYDDEVDGEKWVEDAAGLVHVDRGDDQLLEAIRVSFISSSQKLLTRTR